MLTHAKEGNKSHMFAQPMPQTDCWGVTIYKPLQGSSLAGCGRKPHCSWGIPDPRQACGARCRVAMPASTALPHGTGLKRRGRMSCSFLFTPETHLLRFSTDNTQPSSIWKKEVNEPGDVLLPRVMELLCGPAPQSDTKAWEKLLNRKISQKALQNSYFPLSH